MPVIPATFGQVNFMFRGLAMPTGAEVTLGFSQSDPHTAAQYAESASTAFSDNIVPFLGAGVTFVNTHVKLGPNVSGPMADFPSNEFGASSGEDAAPNVTYLVRKNTAIGGRAGSGRWYLPGVVEENVLAGGTVPTVNSNDLNDRLSDFQAALVLAGMTPQLLQSVATVRGPEPITSMITESLVATQRRRLRR